MTSGVRMVGLADAAWQLQSLLIGAECSLPGWPRSLPGVCAQLPKAVNGNKASPFPNGIVLHELRFVIV